MESYVEPASDGILGRVFPRLQSISMAHVMYRFPVIESFIAVLDRRIYSCKEIGSEEDVEGTNWFHGKGSSRSADAVSP